MCPDKAINRKLNNQRGFLLPLALFILVVMGGLAIAISRTSEQTNSSSIQEFSNIRAFYAAESGAQRGMQALFLTNTTRRATDTSCAAMAINQTYTVNGLKPCTTQVTCACRYLDNSTCNATNATNYSTTAAQSMTRSFYTITSTGACEQLHFRAVRTIQVGAFLNQE